MPRPSLFTSLSTSASLSASAASRAESRRIGCYTTARVSGGRVERVERHASRLLRDAARLGLLAPGRLEIEALLLETAQQAFGRGDGIVRIEWSCELGSSPSLVASHRALGNDPKRWRAGISKTTHPGPEARHNTKSVDVDAFDQAREAARSQGVDEVLLFGADGLLVEGCRTNLLLVEDAGILLTPDLSLGAVEGLGLSLVRERHPELREAKCSLEGVRAARELMAVNAVRGVVPIIELDGEPISGGEPGVWAQRLRRLISRN
jgi:branched-subunit amino acid aminotransferase/4-amino-4-deoxychorismate lyase